MMKPPTRPDHVTRPVEVVRPTNSSRRSNKNPVWRRRPSDRCCRSYFPFHQITPSRRRIEKEGYRRPAVSISKSTKELSATKPFLSLITRFIRVCVQQRYGSSLSHIPCCQDVSLRECVRKHTGTFFFSPFSLSHHIPPDEWLSTPMSFELMGVRASADGGDVQNEDERIRMFVCCRCVSLVGDVWLWW